jgi:hypothetical protein
MKLIIVSFAIAMSLAMIPTQASAWYCVARGTTGASGWGLSGSLYNAKRIALGNCAVRTRRGHTCYITGCR